ncbi:MAG: hypothetical protein H2172_11525 [Opitutus sp.]|nr:hypothetical protein [Opitutus sp.]MCS6247907.1 hypothetical protein [Opitutus sp.]MCS6274978.1 hypothetical protein [Opitutus sp.]MCS6276978.1 hypothetical protein [Opitutus sp.]MCS6299974.1 hypothetical protein [Opitutus sp.]
MPHPSSIWLTLGLSLGALSASAAISLDGLTTNSPFLQRSSAVALPTHSEASTLEFRGVISTSAGTLFGLYDRTRNQGAWVRQNEKGADFNVLAYDAANAVVTVDYQGQKLSLALSSAKIETAAPSLIPMIAAAPLAAPATPAVNGANPTDQRKLESIAAEVRRRRALRVATPAVTPAHP